MMWVIYEQIRLMERLAVEWIQNSNATILIQGVV